VIINISSMAAWGSYPYVAYKTSKAGVIALTEQLAYANARYGIRANVILPGLMNTPMAIESRVGLDGKSREEVIAERDARVPLGRKMGTAWDIAHAAVWLASDKARLHHGRGTAGRRRGQRAPRLGEQIQESILIVDKQLYAGASGYSYKEWKGKLLPERDQADEMLAWYAKHLPTVEINNTFYRMPKRSVLESWAGRDTGALPVRDQSVAAHHAHGASQAGSGGIAPSTFTTTSHL
jgi:hypothetical protein